MLNMFRTLIHPSSGACDFFYCITTLVVCSCFDVCWSFVVAGLEWYLCGRLKQQLCFSAYSLRVLVCTENTRTNQTKRNKRTNCNKATKHITPSIRLYTGCNRRNGPDFGRVFLMLYYTDITQNTYIQS